MKRIIVASIKELAIKSVLFSGIGIIAFLLSQDKTAAAPLAEASNGGLDGALSSGSQCVPVSDQDYRTLLRADASEEDVLFVGCGGFF